VHAHCLHTEITRKAYTKSLSDFLKQFYSETCFVGGLHVLW
jgi:hypothetical protein